MAGEGDIGDVDAAPVCTVHPAVRLLRVYDRYLLTSEVTIAHASIYSRIGTVLASCGDF